jgi:arylsulfatase A-like enzyme
MDVSPTLLDLLDIPIPESMLGQSLRSLIEAPKDSERNAVSEMSAYRAYLTPPHKLIVDASDRRLLLFDLSSDPTEQSDLSEQNPDRARQLYRELAEELRDLSRHPVDGIAKDLPEDEELMEQLRALGYLD